MSELICNVHEDTISKLDKIEDYAKSAIRTLRDAKWNTEDSDLKDEMDYAISDMEDVIYDVSTCIDNIRTAKEMGQKMEDRLREYHDTIECLGFKRDKEV